MLWEAIVGQKKEAVLSGNSRGIDGLAVVAVDWALRVVGGEVEGAESQSIAAAAVVAEVVHCWKACLFDLYPDLMVWVAVEVDCRRCFVLDMSDIAVGSSETGGVEEAERCSSLLQMSF